MAGLKEKFLSGAAWVSVLTIGSLIVGFARSYALTCIDGSGAGLGALAVMLLFSNFALSVGVAGGNSTVTQFLPRINGRDEKIAFLHAYFWVACAWWLGVLLFLFLIPSVIDLIVGKDRGVGFVALMILGTSTVCASVVTTALQGSLNFRLAAICSVIQAYVLGAVVVIWALALPGTFIEYATPVFLVTLTFANVLTLLLGVVFAVRKCGLRQLLIPRLELPADFWKIAIYYQLSSLLIFAYMSLDSMFVLSAIGTNELGFYFLFQQFVVLISFVPKRLGQVMLASFSKLLVDNDEPRMIRGYALLCRYVSLFGLSVALLLITLSTEVCNLFGPEIRGRSHWLILMAVAANIGVLGNINTMIVLAKQYVGFFLSFNVAVVGLQAWLTYVWIDAWGVPGVIAARFFAMLFGQIVLMISVRHLLPGSVEGWRDYLISSSVCVMAAAAYWSKEVYWSKELPTALNLTLYCTLMFVYCRAVGITVVEVSKILPKPVQAFLSRLSRV